MKLTAARNPRWVDTRHNAVQVEVRLDGGPWMTYCATDGDSAPIGSQLWKDVQAGKYGEISKEYLISAEAQTQFTIRRIEAVRMKKLQEALAYESGVRAARKSNMEQELSAIDQYRYELMSLEQQPGFPYDITPPKAPWR